MAITNRERVGKALDLLNDGLLPFVERELKAVYADRWQEIAREGQPPERAAKKPAKAGNPALHLDCHALLTVMWNQWNPAVELQTSFGGGKTHSMMSLWHLFFGILPSELPGVE
jgi:hypothetical protein